MMVQYIRAWHCTGGAASNWQLLASAQGLMCGTAYTGVVPLVLLLPLCVVVTL